MPEPLRLVAARGRIEDDADAHARMILARTPLVEEKRSLRTATALRDDPSHQMRIALIAHFRKTGHVNDVTNWKVPKWPFLLADGLLMFFAYYYVLHAALPVHHWEIAAGCVTLGAVLGVVPFYLDYRAMGKAMEVNALGAVRKKSRTSKKFPSRSIPPRTIGPSSREPSRRKLENPPPPPGRLPTR